MIIDTHVHMTSPGFVRGRFAKSNARTAISLYSRVHNKKITMDEYFEMLKSRVDPDCSKMIATMDRAGIDKSVIFGVDWAYAVSGEPRISNREQNRIHAEMAKKYRGRLIALAALDPRRPDVIDQATEAIEEWGMKGFKIHPSAGFYPQDPICFPLYEKCAKWGVPIVFHSGGGERNWEFAQPWNIATVADHFPGVKMVMAHAGGESSAQALNAAMVLPNVYLDISVMQLNYKLNPDYFYRWLRNLIDWATPWKILFASDAPMPTFWVSNEEWVQAIKEPKTKEVKFTSEEIDIILGKAAEQVFDFS